MSLSLHLNLCTQEYSAIYRDAGAAIISVNVDPQSGGCSHEDIKQMADEQALAAGEDVYGK